MQANQVIVVTGAAKGLGRALSLAMAEKGAIVAAHYHTSLVEAESLLQDLQAFSSASSLHQANLRIATERERLFEEIYSQHGRVDVLINNVGNFIYKPYEQVELEEFNDVLETNLTSVFDCSRLVLPHMVEQKAGHIINFGCAGSDRMVTRERTTPYYIAKTGVLMLTKIMAKSYAEYGVQINAISPGVLESSVAEPLEIPAGRRAEFSDIINAVLFLLSPEASYINGANLEVAGGWIP